jgi:dihydroorotate dehydrogenase (fumarate)
LNGYTMGGWIEYAQKMQQAGADALECNIYYIVTDFKESESHIQKRYTDILKTLKKSVKIPVAIKLNPFFTNIAKMAKTLDKTGADALVLFNRFYQPDIDLDAMEVKPHLVFSTSFESRLALRWIALLYGHIKSNLSATGGVHNAEDAIKLILAGADTVQLCSVLLQQGIGKAKEILNNMKTWMDEKEYESVHQMKGSLSQKSCPDPSAFERANYMKTLLTR